MTFNNLCDSCTNIGCEFQSGIVRTKCAFYMPPYIEPDNCGNYVVMQPQKEGLKDTSKKELAINEEEYISKADYKARLKADLEAILVELQLKIEEMTPTYHNPDWSLTDLVSISEVNKIIQQKINELKAESEEV